MEGAGGAGFCLGASENEIGEDLGECGTQRMQHEAKASLNCLKSRGWFGSRSRAAREFPAEVVFRLVFGGQLRRFSAVSRGPVDERFALPEGERRRRSPVSVRFEPFHPAQPSAPTTAGLAHAKPAQPTVFPPCRAREMARHPRLPGSRCPWPPTEVAGSAAWPGGNGGSLSR